MIVFLNGEFLPADSARISIFDRGFLYGDGLFETLRIHGGRPFLWSEHLERMRKGAELLGLAAPVSFDQLGERTRELSRVNNVAEAMLRITLSRGPGPRGYAPGGAHQPVLAMSLHPAPDVSPTEILSWTLITSTYRLPVNDPLTRVKTCNKLPQILARAQAEAAGADEAIMLNSEQTVAEATSANLFWIEGDHLWTPPLASGALPGITRAAILRLAKQAGIVCGERVCRPESLAQASGVLLTLSSLGVVEVCRLDGRALPQSPMTRDLHRAYNSVVAAHRNGAA